MSIRHDKVPGFLFEWADAEWLAWTRPRESRPETEWPFGSEITLLTYNVWFDPAHAAERANAIIALVASLSPDVAAFQEVSEGADGAGGGFWDVFTENAFIRSEYLISSLDDQNDTLWQGEASHGTVLAIRKAFAARVPSIHLWYLPFKTQDHRSLTAVELCDWWDHTELTIATAHFESDPSEFGRAIRQEQFQETADCLLGCNSILMGDFNVGQDINALQPFFSQPFTTSSLLDVWAACYPRANMLESATYGTLYPHLCSGRPHRLDFILATKDMFLEATSQLIGRTPIRKAMSETLVDEHRQQCNVYPSDHLGVYANLRFYDRSAEPPRKRLRKYKLGYGVV